MTTPDQHSTGRKNRPCPICRRPASTDHSPFCSARCRDRDLLQWLGEGYAIAGPPADPDLPGSAFAPHADDD